MIKCSNVCRYSRKYLFLDILHIRKRTQKKRILTLLFPWIMTALDSIIIMQRKLRVTKVFLFLNLFNKEKLFFLSDVVLIFKCIMKIFLKFLKPQFRIVFLNFRSSLKYAYMYYLTSAPIGA